MNTMKKLIYGIVFAFATVATCFSQASETVMATGNLVTSPSNVTFDKLRFGSGMATIDYGATASNSIRFLVGTNQVATFLTNGRLVVDTDGTHYGSVVVGSNQFLSFGSSNAAASTRTNLGLGWAGITNATASSFRDALGLSSAWVTNTNVDAVRNALGVSASNLVTMSNIQGDYVEAASLKMLGGGDGIYWEDGGGVINLGLGGSLEAETINISYGGSIELEDNGTITTPSITASTIVSGAGFEVNAGAESIVIGWPVTFANSNALSSIRDSLGIKKLAYFNTDNASTLGQVVYLLGNGNVAMTSEAFPAIALYDYSATTNWTLAMRYNDEAEGWYVNNPSNFRTAISIGWAGETESAAREGLGLGWSALRKTNEEVTDLLGFYQEFGANTVSVTNNLPLEFSVPLTFSGTAASVTRSNLFGGSGITTNYQVRMTNATNTLRFTNGILMQITTP